MRVNWDGGKRRFFSIYHLLQKIFKSHFTKLDLFGNGVVIHSVTNWAG